MKDSTGDKTLEPVETEESEELEVNVNGIATKTIAMGKTDVKSRIKEYKKQEEKDRKYIDNELPINVYDEPWMKH